MGKRLKSCEGKTPPALENVQLQNARARQCGRKLHALPLWHSGRCAYSVDALACVEANALSVVDLNTSCSNSTGFLVGMPCASSMLKGSSGSCVRRHEPHLSLTGFEQEVTEETERRWPLQYGERRAVAALDETSFVFERVIADKESGDESPQSKACTDFSKSTVHTCITPEVPLLPLFPPVQFQTQ